MGHSGVNSLTRCNLFCHPRDREDVMCFCLLQLEHAAL